MRFISIKSVSKLALVAALASTGVAAQAGEATGTLTVTANVQATCVVGTVDALDFGNYVQGTGDVFGTSNISLNCGNGVAYSVRLSGLVGAAPRNLVQGANNLQYQLYRDAARSQIWGETDLANTVDGTGTGASVTYVVYGEVKDSTANKSAAPGTYNGTVTVTVAY